MLADLSELSVIEKKIIFLVDRISNKISNSMKNDVIESLSDFGVRFLQTIKRRPFPRWDILVHTAENCVTLTKKELQMKDNIFSVKYQA